MSVLSLRELRDHNITTFLRDEFAQHPNGVPKAKMGKVDRHYNWMVTARKLGWVQLVTVRTFTGHHYHSRLFRLTEEGRTVLAKAARKETD